MGMGVKPGKKRIQALLQRRKLPLGGTWESQSPSLGGGPAAVGVWHLGTWVSAGFMVGLHDLRGLVEPE